MNGFIIAEERLDEKEIEDLKDHTCILMKGNEASFGGMIDRARGKKDAFATGLFMGLMSVKLAMRLPEDEGISGKEVDAD